MMSRRVLALSVLTLTVSGEVWAQTVRRVDGERVTVRAVSTPAGDLLAEILKIEPIKAVGLEPKILTPVTVTAENVTPLQAIALVLKATELDFVIASVHMRFKMEKKDMTRRLVKAVSDRHTRILGHISGRLLLAREPYSFDAEAVFEAAAKHKVAIEINANPHRLDLDWRFLQQAKAAGSANVARSQAKLALPDDHIATTGA